MTKIKSRAENEELESEIVDENSSSSSSPKMRQEHSVMGINGKQDNA